MEERGCPRGPKGPFFVGGLPRGQVGWAPRLPAAGAGRKADPTIMFTFPGSPPVCLPARSPASRSLAEGRRFGEGRGGELHTEPSATAGGLLKNSVIEKRDRSAKDG
jgi:hypothetical protein